MRILVPTLSLHEQTQHVYYSYVEKTENTRILNTSIWTIGLPRTEPTNERDKNMLQKQAYVAYGSKKCRQVR